MTRASKASGVDARGASSAAAVAAAAPAARELLTVDLHGLKSLLLAHCAATGHPASAVVRDALQRHLNPQRPTGQGASPDSPAASPYPEHEGQRRTRLSLRLTLADADDLHRRAQTAGLSLAAWVLQVMRTGHTPATAAERAERIATLTQSNAELATLSRNIAHLTALLRQGEVRAAQEYRQMLDTVAADIRQHLKLAAQLLAAERREAKPPTTPHQRGPHDGTHHD